MQGTGNSLILLYTGNGKGKTSAAMGQMMRALGHDAKCAVAQFIKDDPETLKSGEFLTAQKLGVTWKNFGCGFTWIGDNNAKNAQLAAKGWEQIKRWISTGAFTMILLDEFTYTLTLGYLDTEQVCLWLEDHKGKEGFPHLVITGRDAPPRLVAVCDMVSEIAEKKHHMAQAGRKSEPMIEY
jgi:cob(I)alamin adenosyltransferase